MPSCTSCGGVLKPDAQFCPHCGAAVLTPAAVTHAPGAPLGDSWRSGGRVRGSGPIFLVAGAVLLVALAAIGGTIAYQVLAWRSTPSGPAGSGCDAESDVRSTNGPVDDLLVVTNESAAPVEVHWIDFEGRREKHFDLAPGGTRRQRTPRTYPWVITTPGGECLRVVTIPGTVVLGEATP